MAKKPTQKDLIKFTKLFTEEEKGFTTDLIDILPIEVDPHIHGLLRASFAYRAGRIIGQFIKNN